MRGLPALRKSVLADGEHTTCGASGIGGRSKKRRPRLLFVTLSGAKGLEIASYAEFLNGEILRCAQNDRLYDEGGRVF
jgi:hypothetical protein